MTFDVLTHKNFNVPASNSRLDKNLVDGYAEHRLITIQIQPSTQFLFLDFKVIMCTPAFKFYKILLQSFKLI